MTYIWGLFAQGLLQLQARAERKRRLVARLNKAKQDQADGVRQAVIEHSSALIGREYRLCRGIAGHPGRIRHNGLIIEVEGPTLPSGALVRVNGITPDGKVLVRAAC